MHAMKQQSANTSDSLGPTPACPQLNNPVLQWVSRRHKTYILLSHVLGRNLPSARPENWAYLEQAMAEVLKDGLYSPFHIKTLKKLTGVKTLGPCALSLLRLLQSHACTLVKGRSVVLVVDDLSGLVTSELEQAHRLLTGLAASGFKVIVQEAVGELVPLHELQVLQMPRRLTREKTRSSFHARRIALMRKNAN